MQVQEQEQEQKELHQVPVHPEEDPSAAEAA